MEDDINLNELAIILGLKYNQNELNKIIPNKKDLKFINAISNILYSDNLNNLYENNDSKESNNCEMIAYIHGIFVCICTHFIHFDFFRAQL